MSMVYFDLEEFKQRAKQMIDSINESHKFFAGEAAEEIGGDILALARTMNGVACSECDGRGERAYASTATWRGGIGGQAITSGVCDNCWGTGRNDKTGPDLRKITAKLQKAEKDEM